MGLFDSLLDRVADRVGDAVGAAAAAGVREVGNQLTEDYTNEMQMKRENKKLENTIANERKVMSLEEEKKAQELPSTCPHCGAPTVKKIVCEYCDCKVIDY